MIQRIEIRNFKCFEILKLPLSELTLLSGSNASGKSSLLQVLVLLHQTIRQNEWSNRLILNGDILKLGKVKDVVNNIHGRQTFVVSIITDSATHQWQFQGEREDMSMRVQYLAGLDDDADHRHKNLAKLLPSIPNVKREICDTLESLTYITAERIGPRDYYPLEDRSIEQPVGHNGEYAISRLFSLADKKVPKRLIIHDAPPNLMRQVEAWMRQFFPGCGLEVALIDRMNAVTLGVRTSDATEYHRPVNVGFGLTQVLPILVAVLSANPKDLILIENPEVHLHPAGQALMGNFLAQAASADIQIILETHSDHVLNGIRRTVRKQTLKPKQVSLHFFRPIKLNFDQVVSPQIDSAGNLDVWPEGFFDQFDKDMNHFAGWDE